MSTTRTLTGTIDQGSQVVTTEVSSRTDSYDLGDRVVDIEVKAYVRSRDVEFYGSGLTPDTDVYAFFGFKGQVDVTPNCRMFEKEGGFGTGLKTDTNGNIRGIFRIPEGVFFNGDNIFILTGNPKNNNDFDLEITRAKAVFHSGGLDVTKQHTTLNVTVPTMTTVIEERPPAPPPPPPPPPPAPVPNPCDNPTQSYLAMYPDVAANAIYGLDPQRHWIEHGYSEGRKSCFPTPPPPPSCKTFSTWMEFTNAHGLHDPIHQGAHPDPAQASIWLPHWTAYEANPNTTAVDVRNLYVNAVTELLSKGYGKGPLIQACSEQEPGDPVAQTFRLSRDYFVSAIDLFFERTDSKSNSIFVQLRTTNNGYPTDVILANKEFKISDVPVSKDASIPLKVKFDLPIFVKGGTEYCFVVGGWSPDTRIWVSKLGEEAVNVKGFTVETQPSLGSSFRSQNGSTWNAEQYEDIMYNLYVAEFYNDEMQLKFDAVPEREMLNLHPFEAQAGVDIIRVYHKTHSLSAGDTFNIDMMENNEYTVNITSGKLAIGHTIQTLTGSCTVTDITFVSGTLFKIKIDNLVGSITPHGAALAFTCDAFTREVSDKNLAELTGVALEPVLFPNVVGTVTIGAIDVINGIPVSALMGTHTVLYSDGLDSYTFQLADGTPLPIESGKFGGGSIYVSANTSYNLFGVDGEYLPYTTTERWKYEGVQHNQFNGKTPSGLFLTNNNKPAAPIIFGTKADTFLTEPHKMKFNNETYITANFITDDEFISPFVRTDTFGMNYVANRIEMIPVDPVVLPPASEFSYVSETVPFDGSETYKYVTKTITLKKPALDLVVTLDVYRDIYADFDIYYKVASMYDDVKLDSKVWKKIPLDKTRYSTAGNDYLEFEVTLSETAEWNVDEPFDSFKVKIVGRSQNTSRPATFKNLRAVAVL